MPRGENTKHIQVYMTQEALDKVAKRAKGLESTLSDYLRHLIKKDFESQGEEIDFGVKWGGSNREDS
jgi:hypothetical protein